jgi:hypothetical protein
MARLSARAGALSLLAAAVALTLVWRLAPAGTPPLYDGCITEAYRLLGHSPAPTSARHSYPPGHFEPAEVITGEAPAQAQILMMTGTFNSASPFTVSITPIRAPQPAPGGSSFDGNVYRFAATTQTGQSLQPKELVTIVLRATTSGGSQRTIVRLDGGGWTRLQTVNAGCGDEYEAVSKRLGVFAVVKAGAPGQNQGGGFPVVALIAILAAVLVLAVLFLVRLNRPVRY